jgi:glycosyltransferase involved in cell wall biosynthesis
LFFSPRHDKSLIEHARQAGLDARIFRATGLRALDQALLYFFYLPARALIHGSKESLINFGDFVVPFADKQIYYFDWLYAAIEARDVWAQMSPFQRLGRLFKRACIRAFIDTPKVVTVQSQFVADQVAKTLGRKNTVTLPCPVDAPADLDVIRSGKTLEELERATRFLCLSSFATHKNVTVLLDVAEILKSRGTKAEIVLTLDETDGEVKTFLDRARARSLSDCILNAGVLDFREVSECLYACDALLLPTKLETFGMPYVESLSRSTPVLTSDLAFAQEICRTGTLFFDPDNPADIANTIEKFINNGDVHIDQRIVDEIIDQCRPDRVYNKILSLSDFS